MSSIFSNPFFSLAGQKERLLNVVDTFKSIVTGKPIQANTSSPTVNKALVAAASHPLATAAAATGVIKVATAVAAIPAVSTAIKAATPVVAKAAQSAAKSPIVTSTALTVGAVALTNPKLVTAENVKNVAAFKMSPVAAVAGVVTKEVERQKDILTDPDVTGKEKAILVGADLLGAAAVGVTGLGIYRGYQAIAGKSTKDMKYEDNPEEWAQVKAMEVYEERKKSSAVPSTTTPQAASSGGIVINNYTTAPAVAAPPAAKKAAPKKKAKPKKKAAKKKKKAPKKKKKTSKRKSRKSQRR